MPRPGGRGGYKRNRDGGGRGRGRGGGKRPRQDNEGEKGAGYQSARRESQLFEKFYRLQTFIPEGEFDDFLASLRTPLPSTFRITGNRASAVDVRESLQDVYFERLKGVEVDGEEIQPPKPIPWYPDSLAWHMVLSRPVLRKREDLKSFHRFLVDQNESGNISRQEAVSMIPPLLLGVEPHHKVLDMCAAPGSKTAQLIEALHADGDAIPSGLVVANDAENKRCYLLVHQSKRLQSPSFMITNHDAAVYPNLNLRAPDGTLSPLRYDRVLCDVPCTGDGTFRKNVAAWGKWNPNNAYGLHDLQKRILFRGIELADVGATVVYSTCSFNPVENEAVVAAALRKFKGCLEVVDVSDKLPELKRVPGVTKWELLNRKGNPVHSFAEAPESSTKFVDSVFQPSEEEAEWMHLERCLRLLPHYQDTGGFFVTVLRKTAPSSAKEARRVAAAEKAASEGPAGESDAAAPASVEGEAPAPADAALQGDVTAPEEPRKKSRGRVFKEDPFFYLAADDVHLASIRDFYGLKDDFPSELTLVRSEEGKKRNIYLTSQLVKQVISTNAAAGLRAINAGVKVATRSDVKGSSCDFRLSQEGIACVAPFITKRSAVVTAEEAYQVLLRDNLYMNEFCDASREAVESCSEGCLLLTVPAGAASLRAPADDGTPGRPLANPVQIYGWRGKTCARALVNKQTRMHYKVLLGKHPDEAQKEEAEQEAINEAKKKKGKVAKPAVATEPAEAGASSDAAPGADTASAMDEKPDAAGVDTASAMDEKPDDPADGEAGKPSVSATDGKPDGESES